MPILQDDLESSPGNAAECAFCGVSMLYPSSTVACEDCSALHRVCDVCVRDLVVPGEGYELVA